MLKHTEHSHWFSVWVLYNFKIIAVKYFSMEVKIINQIKNTQINKNYFPWHFLSLTLLISFSLISHLHYFHIFACNNKSLPLQTIHTPSRLSRYISIDNWLCFLKFLLDYSLWDIKKWAGGNTWETLIIERQSENKWLYPISYLPKVEAIFISST